MSYALIPVSGGKAYAKVDPEDFEWLSKYRWSFAGRGYVRTGANSRYMHRMILPGCEQVDHINGDVLDNRRDNLRPATNAQNHQAYGTVRAASGYRGVRRAKTSWEGRVTANGVTRRKEGFATPEEAARWRDEQAREMHGEFFVPSSKEKKS